MCQNPHYFATIESPIGFLNLVSDEYSLLSVTFSKEPFRTCNPLPEVLGKAILQLNDYFKGSPVFFNIRTDPAGTPFQKMVWEELTRVPYGETRTYAEIARKLGLPRHNRAIGHASASNPMAVITPCHRIVGDGFKLRGYAGGLWRKKWLLVHESFHNPNKRTLL